MKNNTFYTYLYLREEGTPYYVGKGTKSRAYVKQGHAAPPPPRHRILVQEFPDENSAFAAEKFLIEFYGRKDLGTGCLRNLTDGGEGSSGCKTQVGKKNSEETRKKISESNKGRTVTKETREKLRVALTGRFMSKETRKKIGEAAKSRVVSESTRRLISEAAKKQWERQRGLSV